MTADASENGPLEARIAILGGGLEGIEALGEILRAYRRQLRFSVSSPA